MIWKLTDTVKNLDKIEMLEDEGGYSEARGRSYMQVHKMSKNAKFILICLKN